MIAGRQAMDVFGRSVRHEPVRLMSDVPTSRVMAYGCSMSVSSPVLAVGVDQPIFGDVGVAYRLHPRDARIFNVALEQMREADAAVSDSPVPEPGGGSCVPA